MSKVVLEAIAVALAGCVIFGGLIKWISGKIAKQEVLAQRVDNLEGSQVLIANDLSNISKLVHMIAGKLGIDTKGIGSGN